MRNAFVHAKPEEQTQKAAPEGGLSRYDGGPSGYLAAADDSSTDTPGPIVDESETFFR